MPNIPLQNGWLSGGGEMGALMRAKDWSRTGLGPLDSWPTSLRTMVGLVLGSRFPMALCWGRDLYGLYNDGYRQIMGGKHPASLGEPFPKVWSEIWGIVGPLADSVLAGGGATWNEHLLLPMQRNGFLEETYFTFSYSPVPDDSGRIGGMLITCQETTGEVQDGRQIRLLRDLADGNLGMAAASVWENAAATLSRYRADIPFALLYRAEEGAARLAAASGMEGYRGPAAAEILPLDGNAPAAWPLAKVAKTGREERVDGLEAAFGRLPSGDWDAPPESALVMPLVREGETGYHGFLVAAVSPRRRLDDRYAGLFRLVAGQITKSLSDAVAFEETRKRAEALAELDRAKTAFFSNVSHEFRTPLTLILGPVEELLQREDVDPDPERREMLAGVHRNCLRLLRLVNTLLDFSRAEAGRARAEFAPVDLAAYTADLASAFRSAMEKAGLEFAVDCPPLPGPVPVDREMWEKIVLNLLSNAYKFTLAGRVSISLRARGGAVELAVADTGTGIPEADLPRIFDRFHRVEGARGRTHEGAGIGLSLVKELVQLHGGDIVVSSRPGRGAVFTVTLPMRNAGRTETGSFPEPAPIGNPGLPNLPQALASLEDAPSPGPVPATEGPTDTRILVVDDNDDMRRYISRLLRPHGRIETAANGEEALSAALRNPPHLVVSDIMMPVLDGIGLVRALRDDARTRSLPILLLSARAGEEAAVAGLEAGADDYLVKPFAARELAARVRSALGLAALRARAGAEIRESERRFRSMADHAPVFIRVTDPDGACTYLSRPWLALTGQDPETALGSGWLRAIHPEDRSAVEKAFLEANRGRAPFRLEYRLRRHDGEYRWALDSAAPHLDGDGVFLGFIGSVLDITDRKEAERALRRSEELLLQTQKTESIGKLAGGIAHDFNNLLTAINGYTEISLAALDGADPLRQNLLEVRAAGERAATLTRQLLAYSRRQVLSPSELDLNGIVGPMHNMLQRIIGEDMELAEDMDPGAGRVRADRGQIEQVILNLVVNARDASRPGGRILLTTRNAELPGAALRLHPEVAPGRYVRLSVSDTGTGMDAGLLDRIFEPFFTTKAVGKGSGMGLAMVFGIVTQSGGYVDVESAPGRGSTFHVYLPRVVRKAAGGPEAPDQAPCAEGCGETVLLAEDEAAVRRLARRILVQAGYRVIEAGDGKQAMAAAESGGRIDILVTDVIMPGMNGRELADWVAARNPEARILFMSGYPDDVPLVKGLAGSAFLQKPFTAETLARALRELPDADGRSTRSAALAGPVSADPPAVHPAQ